MREALPVTGLGVVVVAAALGGLSLWLSTDDACDSEKSPSTLAERFDDEPVRPGSWSRGVAVVLQRGVQERSTLADS